MGRIVFIVLAVFCFLHILRDYMQIKYGYKHSWFTSFGHIWHAPQYEKQGMAVLFLVGSLFLYLAFRHAA